MTISVDVALMSGRHVNIALPATSSVDALRARAQKQLGVPNGWLFSTTGDRLVGDVALFQAGLKTGDVLMLKVKPALLAASVGAFAAGTGEGALVTWGDPTLGADCSKIQNELKNVEHVRSSSGAFAAILADGSVVSWGNADRGGDSSHVQAQLKNAQQISSTQSAFAAILADGSVVTWGNPLLGGDSSAVQHLLKGVRQIQASNGAFAAILDSGSVVTWGDPYRGGDSLAVQDQLWNVTHIQATGSAFAAIRSNGAVVTWGNAHFGGDSSHIQEKLKSVRQVQCANYAFAAILEDGSVEAWGADELGGDCSSVKDQLKDVKEIQASSGAFAALLADGSVVTWGSANRGGDCSAVRDRLKAIRHVQANQAAFAAIREDGSVVTWGHSAYGGDSDGVQDQLKAVQHIQAAEVAFAAIRECGSVVSWGHPDFGGDCSKVQEQLKDVQQLQSTDGAFAAVLKKGALVTWGNSTCGGDGSALVEDADNDSICAGQLGRLCLRGEVGTGGVCGRLLLRRAERRLTADKMDLSDEHLKAIGGRYMDIAALLGHMRRMDAKLETDIFLALAVGGPSPGAVEWLHHQGCFSYAAPTEQVEALVEQAFRICRYDAHCATRELQKESRESDGAGVKALRQRAEVEELLSWWCRRAWEDRRTKEAAEAVKKGSQKLERAQALSSFCRFQTTAKKAARQACQISGGQQDLLRDWQRCRQSRARPKETARRLHEGDRALDPFGTLAREDCCGDPRHGVAADEAVRWLLETAEVTVRRLLLTGQPGAKWTRPQLWRAVRHLTEGTGLPVPYDVILWNVFRGDEGALRSMKEKSESSWTLRYDVEAGSPLYAEVFRRLVQNEGLAAVLDLEVAKEDVAREQKSMDAYEAELVKIEEILDARRDWWWLRPSTDSKLEKRREQLVDLIMEQHKKLEKYHKARRKAMSYNLRTSCSQKDTARPVWRGAGPVRQAPGASVPRASSAAALRCTSLGSATPQSGRRSSMSPPATSRAAHRETEALKAQVSRLRQALGERQRRLRNFKEEVAQQRQLCADLEVQHASEQPHYEHLVEELKAQNRSLQAKACARWDSARKVQAMLRSSEQEAEAKVEGLLERQRRLEMDSARLRKALAALRTRLFGWKQSQRRLMGQRPVERRPSASDILGFSLLDSTCPETQAHVSRCYSGRRSSGSSAALAPVEGSEDSFPGIYVASREPSARTFAAPVEQPPATPSENSARSPDDTQLSAADLDSMRRELRAAEERAAKASQELSAAQAQLVELSTAMAEKRPPLRRSSSYVEQGEVCSTAASVEKEEISPGSKSQETSP
eukprot:s1805_g6.t2